MPLRKNKIHVCYVICYTYTYKLEYVYKKLVKITSYFIQCVIVSFSTLYIELL